MGSERHRDASAQEQSEGWGEKREQAVPVKLTEGCFKETRIPKRKLTRRLQLGVNRKGLMGFGQLWGPQLLCPAAALLEQ